jgi:hypothetical protein
MSGRIPSFERVEDMVNARQKIRNNKSAKINRQFSTENAGIKLKRLYLSWDY